MTLEKTIETLTIAFRKDIIPDFNEFNQALKIAIGGLKAITIYRNDCITKPLFHLPGETKED